MAPYRLSNEAKEDLIRIYRFGKQRFGERQADKYFKSFFVCFYRISQRPYSYDSGGHIKVGYRKCVCGVDSIYYRINGGTVEIMAIVGRQELKNLF